jgi:hypothetical protein
MGTFEKPCPMPASHWNAIWLGEIYNSEAGDRTVFLLPFVLYCNVNIYYTIFVKHSGARSDGQQQLCFHQKPEYHTTVRLRS